MGSKMWDFNCPQFVDFAAGLETPPTTDFFFEGNNQNAVSILNQPFISKMATPKIKLNKCLRNSPFVMVSDKMLKTDDEKMASISRLPHRYSKSDTCLNRPIETWATPKCKQPYRVQKINRKRSLSENNIKKKVYPVTPMCLKRTVVKPKSKAKTSEEIEMDKIAELQNKLKQQLRLNEVNLKRLKNNKAPYPAQKVLRQKNKTKASSAAEARVRGGILPPHQNGLNNRNTKSRYYNLEKVQNSKENRSEALRTKSKKLQSVLDSVFKKSEVASNVLRVVNGDNKEQQRRKKYTGYCGISFFPHEEKTVPQPFSFDTSSVSSVNGSFCFKDLKADKTPKIYLEKENVFRPQSMRRENKMN